MFAQASGVPKGEWWVPDPPLGQNTILEILSKNAIKFFKKGVSPYLREFEGHGPKFSALLRSSTRVLSAPLQLLETCISISRGNTKWTCQFCSLIVLSQFPRVKAAFTQLLSLELCLSNRIESNWFWAQFHIYNCTSVCNDLLDII